jgi:diketogulonate reductase-like aldo/keto reductase
MKKMKIETVTLNDVVKIPADGSTYKAVKYALETGIRHIGTVAAYFNEEEVSQELFIANK